MVTYSNAVQAAQQATAFFKALAFFKAVAAQHTIPGAWLATAICEGGSQRPVRWVLRDPRVAPLRRLSDRRQRALSVQLAWEARYVGGPPDAPGHCHRY